MKQIPIYFLAVTAVCVVASMRNAVALPVLMCLSSQQCADRFLSGCCCPNGQTGTAYNCPNGWAYDTSQKICTRSATSGSDSTGYYSQAYGTCNATTSTYDCYVYNANPADSSKCYCKREL